MGQIEKLKERILTVPADLTYDEMVRFLKSLGYIELTKGRTSGSRVEFLRDSDNATILLHKPHPRNVLPRYAIRQTIETLESRGEI